MIRKPSLDERPLAVAKWGRVDAKEAIVFLGMDFSFLPEFVENLFFLLVGFLVGIIAGWYTDKTKGG